jgi:hypothetical protein
VEVKFQPTPEQDGEFEVWVVDEDGGESTRVESVQPGETEAREPVKDVMADFTAAFESADGDDEAVAAAVERAAAENRA